MATDYKVTLIQCLLHDPNIEQHTADYYKEKGYGYLMELEEKGDSLSGEILAAIETYLKK